MMIAAGANVQIEDSVVYDNEATAGNGAQGGNGGYGGPGGWGGSGAVGGAAGGDGGNGGNGAAGGDGTDGGAAIGGAIYNAGTLTLTGDRFQSNGTVGGNGGWGGRAGGMNNGGDGGWGGIGNDSSTQAEGTAGGNGGTAGQPGKVAGKAGIAGNGGIAAGGAIYNTGSLSIIGSSFIDNHVAGGSGGDGGSGVNGASGGTGGAGGSGGLGTKTRGTGGTGGDGRAGVAGVPAAPGGNGGAGLGGAIYSAGSLRMCSTSFDTNSAGGLRQLGGQAGVPNGIGSGGGGAPGGEGPNGTTAASGHGGNGANGINGVDGGNSGRAGGGAIYSTNAVVQGSLTFAGNQITGSSAGDPGSQGFGGSGGPPGGKKGTNGTPGKAGVVGAAIGPNMVQGGLPASIGLRGRTAAAGRVQSEAGSCVEVVVAPTTSGVLKSGVSWPASPPPIGFTTDESDGDFLQKCLSGCRNLVVWVKSVGTANGIPNAKVKVSVAPITGTDVINPAQGGGYVCQVAFLLNNRDGACGNPLTVTTESAGGAEGKVYLRYFPPAVYVPDGQTPPMGTVTAETHSCGSSCTLANGHADISVGPHLIHQKLGVDLTWDEKKALIEWDRNNGEIINNLKPIDKTLNILAKVLDKSKGLKNLGNAVGDLAKGVKLFGTMADFAMLEWFDQKMGVQTDGLVHTGTTDTIVSEILKYVKNPIADIFIGPLQKALFKSQTYSDQMLKMLRDDYANGWLWTDETNKATQIMNMKLFEASYCADSVCRSLAPGFGIHYNLYVTFSSKAANSTIPFFKTFNVATGYAAPTWIPAQCAQMSKKDQVDLCGGGP